MIQRRTELAVVGVVFAASVLGGCGKDHTVATHQPAAGPARWEAVVLPEATAAELDGADIGYAWWDGRRDGEMSYRNDRPLLAAGEWPEPERPTLDRPRYLSLPKRPETILYFRSW